MTPNTIKKSACRPESTNLPNETRSFVQNASSLETVPFPIALQCPFQGVPDFAIFRLVFPAWAGLATFPSNPAKKEPASVTLTESDLRHFGVASMEKHCSVSELARRWGFSENTIRRYLNGNRGASELFTRRPVKSAATQAFASQSGSPRADRPARSPAASADRLNRRPPEYVRNNGILLTEVDGCA